jgi:predicted Rossmann fold nucleotide-binding protein DprA/Smf involved in DNA uptake
MIVHTQYLGNQELLKLQKTAFLASSNISSEMVLRVYDWATDMRSRRECVVSGFNSKLEQDVLHFLLKGSQPIILVLARRMYKVIPKELQEALTLNRLLIVSVSNAARQSKNTAMMRNKWLCEMADRILLVGVSERSSLYALQEDIKNKQKLITV